MKKKVKNQGTWPKLFLLVRIETEFSSYFLLKYFLNLHMNHMPKFVVHNTTTAPGHLNHVQFTKYLMYLVIHTGYRLIYHLQATTE